MIVKKKKKEKREKENQDSPKVHSNSRACITNVDIYLYYAMYTAHQTQWT